MNWSYEEIIQITVGSPLWLFLMPDCTVGRRRITYSDINWHKDHLAISNQIKSGHKYSGVAILMTLLTPMLVLLSITTTW